MHKGDKTALNEKERALYELIVRTYSAQFCPVCNVFSTTLHINIEDELFVGNNKLILKNGWRDVVQESEEKTEKNAENDAQTLPLMKKEDQILCTHALRKDTKTKPPAHFTEGTLIRAMENIHHFVNNPEHKKMLREGDGIGTSATRTSIISELKRRDFLKPKGKQIVSPELGRTLVDALPDIVKNPTLAALYERMLKSIEEGTEKLDVFISKQETFIKDQITKANGESVTVENEAQNKKTFASSTYKCKVCGNKLIRRPAKKEGKFWWGCSTHPTCKKIYFDKEGKPDYK